MIIEPDFLDHWKTRMLVNLLDDELAPLYLIRLWSHCQSRRTVLFKMPSEGLKAQCRYLHEADKLENAMIEAGFIERDADGSLHVIGWEDHNAKLFANWKNGPKGGRPRKEKPEDPGDSGSGNPEKDDDPPSDFDASDQGKETQTEPTENPTETHSKPCSSLGEPIREDKSKPKNIAHTAGADADDFKPIDFLIASGIERKVALDWLKTRKKKRLADTLTAFEGVLSEIQKAGMKPNDAIKYCCEAGWGSFRAHWPRTGSSEGELPVWER